MLELIEKSLKITTPNERKAETIAGIAGSVTRLTEGDEHRSDPRRNELETS